MSTIVIQDDKTEKTKDGSSAESGDLSAAAAVVPAAAISQAEEYGAMKESFRQSQEKQAKLEMELVLEREAREADRRRLDAISGQTDQILSVIQRAAADEQAGQGQDDGAATQVVPPEAAPPTTPDPPVRPGRMQRMADWINGR